MAAHFRKTSELNIQMYTSVVYYVINGKLHSKSFCVIQDISWACKSKSFNRCIFAHLRDHVGIIVDHAHLWSDDASQHFKNTCSMTALSHHIFLHDCTADWNFFESYHGKGPHDGIGGALKSGIKLRLKRRSHLVHNAYDVYKVAKEYISCTVHRLNLLRPSLHMWNCGKAVIQQLAFLRPDMWLL